jgi:hypothetical protein
MRPCAAARAFAPSPSEAAEKRSLGHQKALAAKRPFSAACWRREHKPRRKEGSVDPEILREYECKLDDWLLQGYQLMADDVDGELRLTVHYVSSQATAGSERGQEYWPMAPEIVGLLSQNGIEINRALAGPRSWAGYHPEERT